MKRSRTTLAVALSSSLAAALLLSACGGSSSAAAGSGSTTARIATVARLHNALPASVRQRGVLRIATDASYAPASSFGADGHTIVGFEPDLGAAIGQVLGVRAVFSNHSFDGLTSRVSTHRSDLVMSAMTDTAEREATVDFVDYFTAGTSILVQKGDPHAIFDLSDLCGRSVAVERGTTQVDLLAAQQANCGAKPITVDLSDANTDALLRLRTGADDAVLTDYPVAAAAASDSATSPYIALASTTQYSPAPYGIAVAKDAPQLRDAVAGALRVLLADGRYAQVLRRWHVSAGALTTITVDGGSK